MVIPIDPDALYQELEEFYPHILADLSTAYDYINICGDYAEVDGYAAWLIDSGLCEIDILQL